MNTNLNNDVLSIISLYAGFSIKYVKNKLKIGLSNNCESCNKRMRRTSKSIIEAYKFPNLWKINDEFYNEQGKFIRSPNTLILYKKIYIPYEKAEQDGLIFYREAHQNGYIDSNNNNLYGHRVVPGIDDIKIYVKKAPSLELLYKALRNELGYNNEDEFLEKLKEYDRLGFDENVMNICIKNINITDLPIKMVIRLCSKCRKKVKKGYIFV